MKKYLIAVISLSALMSGCNKEENSIDYKSKIISESTKFIEMASEEEKAQIDFVNSMLPEGKTIKSITIDCHSQIIEDSDEETLKSVLATMLKEKELITKLKSGELSKEEFYNTIIEEQKKASENSKLSQYSEQIQICIDNNINITQVETTEEPETKNTGEE